MHVLASTYRREENSLYWKRKLGSIAYSWPNGLGKNIKCEGFLQVQSSSGISMSRTQNVVTLVQAVTDASLRKDSRNSHRRAWQLVSCLTDIGSSCAFGSNWP